MKKKLGLIVCISILAANKTTAQVKDSTGGKKYSIHWQATVIPQYHFNFKSPYSGLNSLQASEPVQTSFSTTLFMAYKPFKNTYFVFDPEAAGGKGLSKTLGIAGFPNGEVYRVGDPKPKPFIARLYAEQRFPLSSKKEIVESDINQVKEYTHTEYISVLVGKFSLTDFFDPSEVSHDPRTQFFNWSLMGSGAWDYPANTRGYTLGTVVQANYHDFSVRYAITAMPIQANGPELQFKFGKAMGMVWELEKTHLFQKDSAHYVTVHGGLFLNKAKMGKYQQSIKNAAPDSAPDITDSRLYGRTKWGYYLGWETNAGPIHYSLKGSWNDGKNETWAFTEIDRSLSAAIRLDGDLWKRTNDNAGIAYVRNGLSADHKEYLAKGGYGFLIGDGKLNYGWENIIELYYSLSVLKKIAISPDYQFVLHPAYNKDRGPVHIVAVRVHVML